MYTRKVRVKKCMFVRKVRVKKCIFATDQAV